MIFDITKEDISNKEDIFFKVREIEDIFESLKESYSGIADNVVSIIFDKEVFEYTEQIRFVDPLFFILLLNSHSKYKKQALSINITFLNDNVQIYIHRFLIQFFDYLYIEPIGEQTTQINSKTIVSDEIIAINAKKRTDANKRGIIYYYSKKIYKNIESLSLDEDKKYAMLPIMSVSARVDTTSSGQVSSEQIERLMLYSDISKKSDKTELQKIINIFLKQLQEENNESVFYINSLSMILFEIIDNIKRHTKDKDGIYANGYISFHNDTSKGKSKDAQHELTITDDFEDGLLNRYLDILETELEQQQEDIELLGKKFDEEISELYVKDIKLLKKDTVESDIVILEKLFDIDKTFGMHQLSRISMHFGIPSLMKLLEKLDGSLSIFLHRNRRYYKVLFYKGITDVTELYDKENDVKYMGVDGTYYHIKFPKYEVISSTLKGDENTEITKLSLKSTNYTEFYNNNVAIQEQINLFKFIEYEKLKDTSKIDDNEYIITSYKDFKDKNKEETISDFIRSIYRYAHLHDTKDILIVDFSIKGNETYLFTLVKILYYHEKPNIVNITILDSASFSAVFIGGKNINELKYINNLIAKNYNQNSDNFFIDYDEDENKHVNTLIPSELFFSINEDIDKQYLLPFELFNVDGINILSSMIENNLCENKEEMHVDTQQGYHINQFYKFKLLFENSNWIKRFAFILAKVIKEKGIKVIGTDKYSNVIISSAYSIIEENSDYFVLNSFKKNDIQALEQYINSSDDFIVYSPVVFSGMKIKKKIISRNFENKNKKYTWQCGVKISINDDRLENFSSILNMKLKDENYENVFNSICNKCSGTQERALFKLDKKDSYSLKNFNLENYKSKSSRSYCEKNEIIPRFFDSIYFGHTSRGKNHYTYYTKTIKFFENNIDKIKLFLDDIKIEENKDNIIFAPIHSTNSRFLALVDKEVFDNDAEIHYFDTSKSEQNFYDLKNINIQVEKSNIYFIDDELSSGSTFKYFESLLISIDERLKFYSVIAMIDRASPQDEKVFFKFKENLQIFSKLEIKPIKTEFGNCFLCDRQDEYKKMFDYTVLDMNRFQIAKRVVKLNCNNYNDIDNNLNEDFATKLKTFIKMSAVDFAHKKFEKFEKIDISSRLDIVNEYNKIETGFKEYIWKLLNENLKNNILMSKQYFKDICDYESDIALLKSIAFPKIVYFKNIREIVTIIIIRRIHDIISGECKRYILKNKIKINYIINEKDMKVLDMEIKLKILYKNNKRNIAYLRNCRVKNGVNYLNFLYKTAGYLNINYILDKTSIEYYHYMSIAIKNANKNFDYSHSLLHVYPFAVKMVTSYSDDKLDYFVNNLDEFFNDEKKKYNISSRDYSMTHALYLGNNNSGISKIFKKELQKIKSINIEEKIDKLKMLIKKVTGIDIRNIFINENINIKYDSYDNYLIGSELRDALNRFNELSGEYEENVMKLYKGALRVDSTDIDYMFEPLSNDIDKIDNTWSNMPFKINDEYFIAIRLVDIDKKALENTANMNDVKINDSIWFKPIGCIVLPYNNDYMTHLNYSRNILSLQKDIVEFFKQEFSQESIVGHIVDKQKLELKEKQSKIKEMKAQNELDLQKKAHEELLKNVKLISHTYGDFINIDDQIKEFISNDIKDSDILKDIIIYTNAIKYIFYLGSLESTGKENMEINAGFHLQNDFTFIEDTNSFLSILPSFSNKYKNKYKINSQILSQFQCNILTDEHLYIIVFEFIINGIKNNRNRDVNFKVLVEDAIYIANDGEALNKEDKENLFIEGKSSEKSKGLGIGLSKIKTYLNKLNMDVDECIDQKEELNNYNVIFKIFNIRK